MALIISQIASAGTISGTITNQDDEALPYASLYIAGTTIGTTSNIEGKYTLQLKPGNYTIVFQYVGYKKEVRNLQITDSETILNVVMQPETLRLEEVVVNAENENPAYEIVRSTIRSKKRFQEEITAYKCQVYMKGLQRLDTKPNRILGVNIPLDTGIVYLSESVSELQFHQPNHVSERMISSKVSGNQGSFSFNQASETLFSIYDNLFKVEEINERGYVSPLANNAFFFYDYQLMGVVQEGDFLINKIKVIPRRANDPTFSGYLYIIEDLWRVSKLELTLTKEHQLEFLDILTVKQVHAPIRDSVWVMLSQNFQFHLNTFGFKGSGYFNANYSDYQVELNPKYIKAIKNDQSKEADDNKSTYSDRKSAKSIDLEPRDFKNEILKIEVGANERDDEYWSKVRPVPLTKIERLDYQKKDSIEVFKQSKAYKDSMDAITNELTLGKVLYTGYRYENSQSQFYLSFPSLIRTLQYNTIEGLVVNLRTRLTRYDDHNVKNHFTPEIRYGFSSERLYGQAFYEQKLNHQKFQAFTIGAGHFIRQFNSNGIPPFINSMETLLNRRNYMKAYERTFVGLEYQQEIINGFFIRPQLVYSQRSPLSNQIDYSFFYQDTREFSSNVPENIYGSTAFTSHQSLFFELSTSIRFGQKYITTPYKKIIAENKYPKLNIKYSKGLNILGSDIDFDKVSLKIEDELPFGLIGRSEYIMGGGTFLNNKNLKFMDFNHFNTNASILANFDDDYFQLLDYYNYSTNDYWLEGHYIHHFNGFIINKLPLIRKSKVQSVVSLHYLHTDKVDSYLELGVGIEHIFKLFRADYFTSFDRGNFQSHGIRLGFGF
ncbi:DUF5686 and carboxypeptidase regulatory-like domain-containing protein [Reichenbachiella ulvae]|uniref:DUF5686 and carboxypeptidase regulatory-like domain-containing protein n=1 Tax=Reichenbachiella ulvae TaxID=2980104 RepID=A0ABT3CS94_9BACT|nr:DUF5686 and carboxypeptidase regulatory-like domain-containing protein [Reichenbachiella ulvae]MCV9386374.1 DUF5686 and carboxypeptidase regulatory-like domain-containing protein [Reichenbachiella ulvae]